MLKRTFLLCLLASAAAIAADPPNAVFLLKNSQVAPDAMRAFQARFPRSACDCVIVNETVTAERLKKARVLFLEHPSTPFLDQMKTAALEAVGAGARIVTDVPEMVQRAWGIEPDLRLTRRLMPYWQNGGPENMLGFFLTAFQEAGGPKDLAIAPPIETPKTGVYHPDAPKIFPDLTAYLQWYRAAKPGMGKLAAVSFFPTYLNKGDVAFVDALLRELEKRGLAAAGVFGWPHHTLENVFATPPDDPLKVLLASTLSLSKPEDLAFTEKHNVHIIGILTTRNSYAEWAASDRGVTPERVQSSLSDPERTGVTEAIMVATNEEGPDGVTRTMPIPERVEMAAMRALRWVTLSEKPNFQKKLAILYYNNPPGKGNIGASYLNLAPSIRAVLETLRNDGYRVGANVPPADWITNQLEKVGRNIETWAPGELTAMLSQGGVTLLPVSQYRQWFDELPEQFRRAVNERWGIPEKAELMAWKAPDGRRFFVIPGVQFENVFLGPQLLRASSAEYTNVQHSGTLPPHHGYVAAYLYYRYQLGADAIIHMGRHGTLEWLPGKNAGQAGWDASEAILGDLPNINYYIMDGDGEAIQARRRSAAVDLSHLTPMLALAGPDNRFQVLMKALHNWEDTYETSPLLAKEYASTAMAEIARLKLGDQIGVDLEDPDKTMRKVHDFLDAMEEAPLPLGLPVLGAMPSEDRQRAGLAAYMTTAFQPSEMRTIRELVPGWSEAVYEGKKPEVPAEVEGALREKVFRVFDDAHGWLARLRASPERELNMLLRVLRGEFLPSGIVGDPLASGDALPSGRNLHQGDPSLIPTKAAWEVGKKLAGQLLDKHLTEHGSYPERVSMVLWQGESGRHQGAMESQALYLMGVEPEWNARGVVDRLKLIPEEELGRPRVNVVFTASGLYRDGMADKIIMLDRAARMAASAGDNALSRQNREVKNTLVAGGMPEQEADDLAGARVFTTAPGAYGFGLERFVEQSRDKDEPKTMAELYLSKMNYVYSEKTWGKTVPKLLENQLRGNQAILHSNSSNLYGAVDNDDVYQWMGGLRVASEAAGAKPEVLINNLRRAGQETVEDARSFIAKELHSRNWNPKWISEMQKEGYSGAREMMKPIEYLYGWQATAPDTVSPNAWKKMYDVYVADEYNLGLGEFFDKSNPAAKQVMVARLLEIDRQGVYTFSTAERRQLVRDYVRLVSQNGVACSANVCGNRRLQAHVMMAARRMGDRQLSKQELAEFQKRFERALKNDQTPTPASRTQLSITQKRRSWDDLKVRWVKIGDFTESARRVVRDNPILFAGIFGCSIALGGLVAFGKRRPQPWAELRLQRGTEASLE
jgi:cobaltochelatase CobN